MIIALELLSMNICLVHVGIAVRIMIFGTLLVQRSGAVDMVHMTTVFHAITRIDFSIGT